MTTPEAWTKVKLSQIADIGWGDLSVTKKSYVESGYTAFSATGADGYLPYFDYDQDGIVVSAIGANCGKIWRAYGNWSCIKNTMRILVKDAPVSLDYLYYFLSDPKVFPKRGSGQPFISKEDARDIEIAYPLIDEQHKIVELLEGHLSRLDAALADVNHGKKKIRQFRRSFLQDAFIEREGTRHCSLGDVVEIKTGKIDANKAVPDGKYPFFTCAREISRIDDAPFDGKVVLVAGNGDLNVKYYEGKFNAYQRTYILKSKNEEILFPKYLFWFMEHYLFELRNLAIGTTIKYIKLGNLMDAIMSLPPINIQKQMVLEIERSLSFVDNSEETFTKLIRESRSLRRAILNSAFSGELTNEVSHV